MTTTTSSATKTTDVRAVRHGDAGQSSVELRWQARSRVAARCCRVVVNELRACALEAHRLQPNVGMKSHPSPRSGRAFHGEPKHPRPDDGNAFLPDTVGQMKPLPSPDAEAFAEEFINSATGAESVSEDAEDEVSVDEDGGPYIVLDDKARLPTEAEEESLASEDPELDVEDQQQGRRGARWAAKGV
jgi:hypothetical protein